MKNKTSKRRERRKKTATAKKEHKINKNSHIDIKWKSSEKKSNV